MSKPPAPKARASFSASAFSNLRSAAGEGQGEPLSLLLAEIDEDPAQPRTVFDDDQLEDLAASIRELGVLQPIVVQPPQDGRYQLVFGARRFRAAKRAGLRNIPAVVRAPHADDYAAQIVENQHRANLGDAELIAAIEQLTAAGKTKAQIAVICSLKEYQLAPYRAAAKFPGPIKALIGNADIRALYDLYRQWGKTPDAILTALEGLTAPLTITEARRIIATITGQPSHSIAIDHGTGGGDTESATEDAAKTTEPAVRRPLHGAMPLEPGDDRKSSRPPVSTPSSDPVLSGKRDAEAAARAPVFIVQSRAGAELGRLITDRRAEAEGWALVAFDAAVEEVPLNTLRIVRIE